MVLMPSVTAQSSIVLQPGEGEVVTANPTGSTVLKITGAETGGAFTCAEATLAAHTSGPPLHINSREDEAVYVLEGTITFQLEDRRFDAPAGSFILLRRGVPHTFANLSDAPARFLGFITPAGFEGYFRESAALLQGGAPVNPEAMIAVAQRYGGILVGPPLR
jgi:quercetin dioxygenase-like cupin family protein